jgi:hypothetical protein
MGMVLLSPTSIAFSGTSASIGANGQVTFTAVTSLSLNGVFTSAYDNYLMAIAAQTVSGDTFANFRLRVSGSDASGSNYTRQRIYATSTTVAASRESSQDLTYIGYFNSTSMNGTTVHVYGPALAQPTAIRNTSISSTSSAYLIDIASTHSLSTAYDGFTITSGSMTGKLAVYGIRS